MTCNVCKGFFSGEFLADASGEIEEELFSITSKVTITADHIRTDSESKNGEIYIVLEPVITTEDIGGDCEGLNGDGSDPPDDVLLDKIYLPNQNKSDSVKDVYINGVKYNRKVILYANGLAEGDKVFVDIAFDKINS